MSRRPALPQPEKPAPFGGVVLYPDVYPWYVLLASLDLLLTGVILHYEGHEVNPLARWVVERYDWYGLVAYKYSLVVLVVAICEIVGRARTDGARRLAEWAVAVTAIPVVIAMALLYYKMHIEDAAWNDAAISP